jgi:nitroreductase
MLEEIRSRRSVRMFTPDQIEDHTIDQIIEMGTWAPSGLNNQPWRFIIVRDQDLKHDLSLQTKYSHVIQRAPACIAVFLEHSQSYDLVKDIQAIGACIQNMLLTIHHLGLGGVLLGEILKKRESVERILETPKNCELMPVIAIGYPAERRAKGNREAVDQVIIGRK